MKRLRLLCCCALCALVFCGAVAAAGDPLVRTLPTPDTSKLAPQAAKELARSRADFEKAKINLIGNDLALAYAQMGALYFRAGFDDAADIAFYDANQLAPKDARWLYMRGVVAQVRKRNTDARAAFEAALALDKVYLPIRYRLADTLTALGDLDAANTLLAAALPAHTDQAVLFAMLGRLEVMQKRYGDAIEHLQAALKLEPQANALYKDLAAAYAGQGDAQLAKQMQAKAGTVAPNLADPIVAGMFQAPTPAVHGTPLEKAQQLLALRDFPRAREQAVAALDANPNDVEAMALLARLDGLLGNSAFALAEAADALKLAPDSASANLSQGMVYEFAGDDAKALPFYQRATQLDANSPDAWLLVGNAQMRRGNYTRAVDAYRNLVRILSTDAGADARLAAALAAAGRCADALAGVNKQLITRPKDGELMQVFVRLASTCPAATRDERNMALDYGTALYKQRPDAADSTALALAQAANGKFEDAQKSQAQAIFEALRAGDKERAAMYRQTMQDFAAKRVPQQPWPAEHPYRKPALLTSTAALAPKK